MLASASLIAGEALAAAKPDRFIAVWRELTKIHESIIRANAADVLKHFQAHIDQVRGEVFIVIAPQ